MPRRLVKHTSGCVWGGVSRDEWQVGQQQRGKDLPWIWVVPFNRQGPYEIRVEKRGCHFVPAASLVPEQVRLLLLPSPADVRLQIFHPWPWCGRTARTLQGASRPLAWDWDCMIGPLVLRLLAFGLSRYRIVWLSSLQRPLWDCSVSSCVSQSNKSSLILVHMLLALLL
jgi:hypothetical protein